MDRQLLYDRPIEIDKFNKINHTMAAATHWHGSNTIITADGPTWQISNHTIIGSVEKHYKAMHMQLKRHAQPMRCPERP